MDHSRKEDAGAILRINREVPLWSILTALALVMGQAVGLYTNQINQTNTIAVQADSIHTLSTQYSKMSSDVSALALAGVESKMKLEEFERRLNRIEVDRTTRGKP